jgi:hypothetical protein
MEKVTHFRTAIHLSLVTAFVNLVGWSLISAQSSYLTTYIIKISAVPFVIFWGLWVQSVFISALGVVWMLFWSAALLWPLVSSGGGSIGLAAFGLAAFFVISAALNLATAGILLTKKSRGEFAYERAHQSKYKTYFRRLVFGVVIAAMVVATVKDIVNIASS